MFATCTLPPTAANPERDVMFVEVAPGRWIMTVTQVSGARVRRKVAELYQVEETEAIGFMGRSFFVLKDGAKCDTETVANVARIDRVSSIYETHLHTDGRWKCSCKAGQVGQHKCIHTLALEQLQREEQSYDHSDDLCDGCQRPEPACCCDEK